jgi:hypothetical protein
MGGPTGECGCTLWYAEDTMMTADEQECRTRPLVRTSPHQYNHSCFFMLGLIQILEGFSTSYSVPVAVEETR